MSTLLFDRRGASDPLSQSRTLDVSQVRYGLECWTEGTEGTEALKKLWRWLKNWPNWPNPYKEVDRILAAENASRTERRMNMRRNGNAIPLRSITREQWAKHPWLEVTQYGDNCRMYVQSAYEREPAEAKQAWDEFEIFQKLWHEENNS